MREQLSTPMDLCATAYVHAEQMIREVLAPNYDRKISFTLKVNSSDMGVAVPLAYAMGGTVELDFNLDKDEWILHGYTLEGATITIHEVYSPGA